MSAVNSRINKKSHKHGIEVSNSSEDATWIDKENDNTFWSDATKKEIENVDIASKVMEEDQKAILDEKNLDKVDEDFTISLRSFSF